MSLPSPIVPAPIVLVFDGLRASALGAYGNSVIETSTFNRLAADGVAYDWCHVPTTSLDKLYALLWSSVTPSLLVTDDGDVARLTNGLSIACATRQQSATQPADLFSGTELAQLAQLFCNRLDEAAIDGPIWLHAKAFAGVWDSPTEVAQSLADEDGAELAPNVTVPEYEIGDDNTSDDRIFIDTCRYHAELIAIDAVLEGVVGWLAEHDTYRERPLIVCGSRGFALGEHGVVGILPKSLLSEHTHVPCLVINHTDRTQRDASLVWLTNVLCPTSQQKSHSHLIWSAPNGSTCVRTARWLLQQTTDGNRLFVKPDDRWEANDVASLCADELAELMTLAASESDVAS